MMDEIRKIIKFLPNESEIPSLLAEEPEAAFILKSAAKQLEKLLRHDEDNKLSIDTDTEESFYLVRSVSDKMWERINIAHFSKVPNIVRQIYSLANYYKIIHLLLECQERTQIEKCYEILDKAIIIGNTHGLYDRSDEFVSQMTKILSNLLGNDTLEMLPLIESVEYEENATCDIESCSCPSIQYFKDHHFMPCKPVLIRNSIKHWPAMQKWRNPNYIMKVAGHRTLPVEIGSTYTTEDWTQEMVKVRDFLLRQFSSKEAPAEVEYLAQHELFDQIPQLKDDIRVPDYCCLSNSNEDVDVDIKAWLGPEGTISPLHQDPKHNILCQVFGTKKVILASCNDTQYLYPYESNFLENTSKIDAENIDYTTFPLAKNAKFYTLLLQEGDGVYIPPKWWHFVKSLSKSFSVSFWWE